MIRDGRTEQRVPLHVKVGGPAAVPIAELIERGEAAAQRVSADYAEHARTQAKEIATTGRALLKKGADGAEWNSLYTLVRDLRTSGESANRRTLTGICESLEFVWTRCDRNDRRLPAVINLHLDALVLAAAYDMPEETLQRLETELGLAAGVLRLGEGHIEP